MTSHATGTPEISDQAHMVCEALGVDATQVHEFSREPLGPGSVVGFIVTADGAESTVYVDTSGIAVEAETGFALEGVGRIWLHPSDPHLPALAPAAFGTAAQTLLSRLAITGAQQPSFTAY